MDKAEAIERFIFLARQIPDDRIEEAMEQLEEYLERQGITVLMPLEEESRLKPEFLAGLREAEEEIKRGETVPMEEVMKEFGYEN